MADFKDDDFFVPFAGNIGLRLVHADDTASGSLLLPASLGATLTPATTDALSVRAVRGALQWPQTSLQPRAADATRPTCCRR